MPKEKPQPERPRGLVTVCLADVPLGTPKTPLSDADLAEIERRSDAATLGGWVVLRESEEWGGLGMPVCRLVGDPALVVGHGTDLGPAAPVAADAAFIAHARKDIPRLLAEVARLRRDLARALAAPGEEG
jgi:hypothetical protein